MRSITAMALRQRVDGEYSVAVPDGAVRDDWVEHHPKIIRGQVHPPWRGPHTGDGGDLNPAGSFNIVAAVVKRDVVELER